MELVGRETFDRRNAVFLHNFDASEKISAHANHTFYFLCFELIPQLFLTKHNTANVHALLGKDEGL